MRRRAFITALGAAGVVWRLPARAHQKALPVIGYLSPASPSPVPPFLAAFRLGLGETGYVEGQNVAIEFRWAEGHYDRLATMAADLVDRKVDVIVASTPPSALAAKDATSSIPIVFSVGVDPVAAGLVASLARPGGNLTGASILFSELTPKRFELLSELVPQARVFALLVNPNDPIPWIGSLEQGARAKGAQLAILKASTPDEIDAAFASVVARRVDAIVIGDDPFSFQRPGQIVALAARNAVPAIYYGRDSVVAGGLLSYGPNLATTYRQVGIYAGRILKGAKPADLPVQQPTTFELVINLKTAEALGLAVPQSILARADEVIE